MDEPIDTSSMEKPDSDSETDLVDLSDSPSQEDEIQEDEVQEDDIQEDDIQEDDIQEDDTQEDDIQEDDTQEDDIQEEAMQEEEPDEGNNDEKDHITNLPFELIDKTFAELPREDRLTTTSRVSKKFMDVNRAHIYKSIRINLGEHRKADTDTHHDDNDDDELCLRGLGEFAQLFKTLLMHDELRDRVLSLTLTVHHHDLYLQVHGHLENLLTHLHSLRELSLNPPPPRYDLPSNPTTTSLRLNFRYDAAAFWHGAHTSSSSTAATMTLPALELTQFFHIKHVRTLRIEHVSFAPEFHRAPYSLPRPDRTSPVVNLRFTDCSPQTIGTLPHLLLLPESLQTFVLETRCPQSVAQAPKACPHEMDAAAIQRALEPHASSLEQLVLAFSDGAGFLPTETVSFRDWTNLTRLALPEAFLVSADATMTTTTPLAEVLPYRLQELQLQYLLGKNLDPQQWGWGTRARIIARLEDLAADKGIYLPELSRVGAWFQGGAAQGVGEEGLEMLGRLEMLQGLFCSVGVEFEWCFEDGFEGTRVGREVGVKIVAGAGAGGDKVEGFTLDEEGCSGVGLYYDGETHSVF